MANLLIIARHTLRNHGCVVSQQTPSNNWDSPANDPILRCLSPMTAIAGLLVMDVPGA